MSRASVPSAGEEFARALQLSQAGEAALAEPIFEEIAATADGELAASAALNLGMLRQSRGDLNLARTAYERASAFAGTKAASEAAFRFAVLRSYQGDVSGAKAGFQAIVDSGSEIAGPAAAELGRLAEEGGDEAAAKAFNARSAGLGVPDPVGASTLNWAQFLDQQGDVGRALASYEKAMSSTDGLMATRAAWFGGLIYERAGRAHEAEAAFRKAADSVDPEISGRARFELGSLLKKLERLADAALAYRVATESPVPEVSGLATYQLGRVLKRQGNIGGARLAYRQAASSPVPKAADPARFNLGLLLEEGGDLDAAEVAYRLAAAAENAEIASRAERNLRNLPLARAFRKFAQRVTFPLSDALVFQHRGDEVRVAIHSIFDRMSQTDLGLFARKYLGNPRLGDVQLRYSGTRWFGSSQRDTLIPPHDMADLDLMVAFQGLAVIMTLFDDGENFLRMMADLLRQLPASVQLYEGECVRLDFGRPPLIDVFAGVDWFGNGAAFNFPHGARNTWYRSNPKRFDAAFAELDIKLAGRLSSLVRMLKNWNRHRKTGLPSFYLEELVVREHPYVIGNWPIEIKHFFESGAQRGDEFLRIGTADGFVQDLSTELADAAKARIRYEFAFASKTMALCMSALEHGDVRSALGLMSELFGPDFPTEGSA